MSSPTEDTLARVETDSAAWQAEVDRLHAAWNTPEPHVRAAAVRATGAAVRAVERVRAGMSSEVYAVATDAGAVFVRIGHEEPRFHAERWALDRCRALGVPTPRVLLLEQLTGEDGSPPVCVVEAVAGVPLGRALARLGPGAPRAVRLLRAAGRMLGRIHTVGTDGHGPLDANGRGPEPSWDRWLLAFADAPDRAERTAALLDRLPKPDADVAHGAVELLRAHRPFLRGRPARLLHHDYEPWHLFVDEQSDEISGVIDMESCQGGDPTHDLVQWHVVHDAYAPFAELLAGYREAVGPDAGFDLSFRLTRLRFRVRRVLDGAEADPADALAALRRELATFG